MAGRRAYTVAFQNVGIAAVQDLIAIYCGSAMAIELHGVALGQITASTVQSLRLSVKRLAATVTPGSLGNSATPQKLGRGDAAATATARINDTTQATSSGATALVHADVVNLVNGYQFFWPPNDMPTFGLGEACIFSLDTAPGASLVMNGTLYFAELI